MEVSLPRRERERQRRRQEMLRAARVVFAEKGYSNATIDEVAQRAEYGKGTLYNYFEGGKEEILFAIFEEFYNGICNLIETDFTEVLQKGRPFRETFHGFLTASFSFFKEHQDLFVISMKEAHWLLLSEDQEKKDFFIHHQQGVIQALTRPIEAAIASGTIRPMQPDAIAHMILGNVKGLQMHLFIRDQDMHCSPGEPMTPREAADFLTTMLLDGLLPQPEPQPMLQPTDADK